MQELFVPYALDETGSLHTPSTAEKKQNFFCPACHDSLIFKKGDIRVAHFAHKVSNTCNQETIIHKTSKLIIQKVIREWKNNNNIPPAIMRICKICNIKEKEYLPKKVNEAILECKLGDGTIADIGLKCGNEVEAAIELKVTHAVDDIKANRISVPFIELNAEDVIQNPYIWKPIIDKFNPFKCKECLKHESLLLQKERQDINLIVMQDIIKRWWKW